MLLICYSGSVSIEQLISLVCHNGYLIIRHLPVISLVCYNGLIITHLISLVCYNGSMIIRLKISQDYYNGSVIIGQLISLVCYNSYDYI